MQFIDKPTQYVDTIEYILSNIDKNVTFKGTVHRVRDMGDFAFIIVRTNSDLIQCMLRAEAVGGSILEVKDGEVIEVTGSVHEEPRANNGVEVVIDKVKVLAIPYDTIPVPLGKKYMGLSIETDLSLRQITLRHPVKRAVFKVQSEISNAFSDYMRSQGFVNIHTPKIVSAGAEGGANIFKIDYFGQDAYLAQSPQFYKQYMAGVYGRVFEVGGVYRAERHSTSRHLNEYVGLDFELCYIEGIQEIMEIETGMIKFVVEHLEKACKREMELLNYPLPKVSKIPSIRFHEAKDIMNKKFNHKSKNRYDLDPNEEQMMCDWAKDEFDSEFIFVTHFPSSKRPFYAKDDDENPDLALSFDLLFRGLEITTGGQRINDYKEQYDKIVLRKMNPQIFEGFLVMHKYGMPPHGGLGIGLERLTMKMLNLKNVREASLFPRDMNRMQP